MSNNLDFKISDKVCNGTIETEFSELVIDYANEVLLEKRNIEKIINPKNFLERLKKSFQEFGRNNRYSQEICANFKEIAYNKYNDSKLFYLLYKGQLVGFVNCFYEKKIGGLLIGNISDIYIKENIVYNKNISIFEKALLSKGEQWLVDQGASIIKSELNESKLELLKSFYDTGYDCTDYNDSMAIVMVKTIKNK